MTEEQATDIIRELGAVTAAHTALQNAILALPDDDPEFDSLWNLNVKITQALEQVGKKMAPY